MKKPNFNKLISTFLVITFSLVNAVQAQPKQDLTNSQYGNFEGSWQYKVKVKDTTMFNGADFYKPKPKASLQSWFTNLINPTKIKKNFYSGGLSMKASDIFYHGFFTLSDQPKLSKEVIGSYFPHGFANLIDNAPIAILTPPLPSPTLSESQTKPAESNQELFWISNFANKSVNPENTVWVSKGIQGQNKNKMRGYTIVYSCNSSANAKAKQSCEIINIARWQAQRIPSIKYFSLSNYRWKPIISKILIFLDPSGRLDKSVLENLNKEPDNPDDIYGYELINKEQGFIKGNIKAALPAAAQSLPVGKPDPALTKICSPSYCAETARYWKGGDVSDRDGQLTCQTAVTGRRSLCCNSLSAGGGELAGQDGQPACKCTMSTAAVSSATCCRAVATCQTVTSKVEADGKITNSKTNTKYGDKAPSTPLTELQTAQIMSIDPVTARVMQTVPGSGPGYAIPGIPVIGTNKGQPLCPQGLPCGTIPDLFLGLI